MPPCLSPARSPPARVFGCSPLPPLLVLPCIFYARGCSRLARSRPRPRRGLRPGRKGRLQPSAVCSLQRRPRLPRADRARARRLVLASPVVAGARPRLALATSTMDRAARLRPARPQTAISVPSEDRVAQATRIARELLDDDGARRRLDAQHRRADGRQGAVAVQARARQGGARGRAHRCTAWRRWARRLAAGRGRACARARPRLPRVGARPPPPVRALHTAAPPPRPAAGRARGSRAAAPVLAAVGGDRDRARALWAAAHGLVSLELADRFPADADVGAAWDAMVDAFTR